MPIKQALKNPKLRRVFEDAIFKYVGFVRKTCRLRVVPADVLEHANQYWPFIITTWHGQSYILPFALRLDGDVRVLVSGSSDGRYLARAMKRMGFDVITGSGGGISAKDMIRKESFTAFDKMLNTLRENQSLAVTADVPKTALIAGLGVVKLAQRSGCPIIPVAVTTSHRISLGNWDRTLINLPFGRLAVFVGDPIKVDDNDDPKYLEQKRLEVENSLNSANIQVKKMAAYWRD